MQLRSRTGAAILALTALSAGAQVASATTRPVAPTGCTAQAYFPALLPFGDLGFYALAPQGSFEGDISGWTITGGATQVPDPAYAWGLVRDTTSLQLAPGASATSPPICANAVTTSFRMFLRAVSAKADDYRVDVTYLDNAGGTVRGVDDLGTPRRTWTLTAPARVRTDKIALDAAGWGRIKITVTAPDNSPLRVDDIYIDPRMR